MLEQRLDRLPLPGSEVFQAESFSQGPFETVSVEFQGTVLSARRQESWLSEDYFGSPGFTLRVLSRLICTVPGSAPFGFVTCLAWVTFTATVPPSRALE